MGKAAQVLIYQRKLMFSLFEITEVSTSFEKYKHLLFQRSRHIYPHKTEKKQVKPKLVLVLKT